jgi:hypothetical protein
MAVGCNGALGLQQSASAKIFDSRGFASFEVSFKNGRGLPLPQQTSFVDLRLRVGNSGFGGRRSPQPLAKQKRIVAKVDALMALVDPFEQQLDDSRAAAELTAA